MSKDIRRETASGVARLLEWAATVPLSAIDARVLERAALVLSDDLAAMIVASGEAQVAAAQRAFAATSSGHESTVFAAGTPKLDRYSAAAASGMAAVWAELDEGYRIAPCHAGAYAVAAGTAEAEASGVSLGALLGAIAVSYEISGRFARAFPFEGFSVHPHGCFVSLGAAAVVAKLRQLSVPDFTSAVTGATSMAYAGPYSHAIEGTLVRNAWTATGAWTGMRAVDLARAGIGGATTTPYDVFAVCFRTGVEIDELTRDLGVDWAIVDGYHKVFACCQYAHAAVEANLALVKQLPAGMSASDIDEIVVETHLKGMTLTTIVPQSVLAAKFSFPHILAASAILGTASARAFFGDTLTDQRIAALRQRVRLEPYAPIGEWPNDRPGRVTWRLKDGRALQAQSINARGGADMPFSVAELMDKSQELTAGLFPHFTDVARTLVTGAPAKRDARWRDIVAEMTRGATQ